MQTSLNTSKWYDRIWAAFLFFTRLPLWRLHEPHRDAYKTVVEFWPLVGWLTGGIMAATLWFGSLCLPYSVAVLLAIAARVLLTGALHEDGLADFFDAFGGNGNDRQRILEIMKDSRIGTYGVLGLVFYVLLLYLTLSALPPKLAALTILAADPYAKMIASQLIMMLPYARNEQTAKSHTVYRRMSIPAAIGLSLQGMLPIGLYLYYFRDLIDWQYVVFVPCLVMYFLYMFINKKLRSYTGDCCGAVFLLIELSIYLTIIVLTSLLQTS